MALPVIAPAILVSTFDELAETVRRVEATFPYAQLDIMDGEFVSNRSFPEVDKVRGLNTPLKFELHLMVKQPVEEMKKWREVKNVFRVIVHAESESPAAALRQAREWGWQTGVSINPETPLAALEPLLPLVDVVQFMTVHPGRQGAPFVGSVKEKIKELARRGGRPPIAVDGAVGRDNIAELRELGVDIFNVGSALVRTPDISAAREELMAALTL